MGDAGQKLKRIRERLGLTYRDVEEFSARIAEVRGSDEFTIALSRLSDIENRGTVPSLHRLYTLCAVYRLEITEVLSWFGASLTNLAADAAMFNLKQTHRVGFLFDDGEGQVPLALDPGLDLTKTVFLSRFIQRWGKIPLMLLSHGDLSSLSYGFIGTEDWSMFPILCPGAFVVVDQDRRRIASSGWTSEFDRPIYFFERRDSYACGWCSLKGNHLTVQPHPSSHVEPEVYIYPEEIEVIGQVTGVAMTLEPATRRPRQH